MKVCRQCRRTLDDSEFRQTASRSMGIRKSTPGSRNICRFCESCNTRAHVFVTKLEAGEPVDEAKLEQLRKYYSMLMSAGCQPVTKAAQRLMGIASAGASAQQATEDLSVLYEHLRKVRDRAYSSVDEADAVHRKLVLRLKAAGLYEEATNLLDDWWLE